MPGLAPRASYVVCWAAPILAVGLVIAQQPLASAPNPAIAVQVDQPGPAIPHTLFGLFFEDINFAADGGLYPERVKNGSFEFPDPWMGWTRTGGEDAVEVLDLGSAAASPNRHFIRLKGGAGLTNEGFRGIGIERGAEYTFSIRARRAGNTAVVLRASVDTQDGRSLGQTRIDVKAPDWREYRGVITANATDAKARLTLRLEGSDTAALDRVSLYPNAAIKNGRRGLRPGLVKLLKEMKPGFLRFPGGCIVEGRNLEQRYQWKTTVGPRDDRRLIVNRWNTEFRHRPTPDYYQSFGLGFFEYFQLCEEIGAEPLPILNCGMACQFNTGELVPLTQLDPYVHDALDLIEFANGPASSRWGRVRAEMGHPAPFHLKMMGVGNEQWGPQYVERYEVFARQLKLHHPEIVLVSDAGPSPNDERFDYLWGKLRELKAELVDEHYYMPPQWFRDHADRYDDYSRTGPKVFAGEYAAQSAGIARPDNRNNWECALSEAAFMTGLERNCDVVRMSSYAPLFGHVDAWQWTPNLIWFDNLRSYGTPNYYVQKLFSTNHGTRLLPAQAGNAKNGQENLYTCASLDELAHEVVLTVVNTAASGRDLRITLAGAGRLKKSGRAIVLASEDLKAENSLDAPKKLAPVTRAFSVPAPDFSYTFAANSVTVLRVAVAAP